MEHEPRRAVPAALFAGNARQARRRRHRHLAGKEVIVPCMVDGNKDDLQGRHGARSSGCGPASSSTTTTRSATSSAGAARTSAASPACPASPTSPPCRASIPTPSRSARLDFDGDGKPDLCLAGAGRVALLQNGGESLNEVSLPGAHRLPRRRLGRLQRRRHARPAAGHADRAEALHQPRQGRLPRRQPPAAARAGLQPDLRRLDRLRRRRPARLLLGNGFHGLRLYRNKGAGRRAAGAAHAGQLVRTSARSPTRRPGLRQPSTRRRRRSTSTQKYPRQGRRGGRLEGRQVQRRRGQQPRPVRAGQQRRRRRLPLPRDRLRQGRANCRSRSAATTR